MCEEIIYLKRKRRSNKITMYNFRDSALGWVNVSMRAYMYISLFTEDIIPTGKWQREKENKKKKKRFLLLCYIDLKK